MAHQAPPYAPYAPCMLPDNNNNNKNKGTLHRRLFLLLASCSFAMYYLYQHFPPPLGGLHCLWYSVPVQSQLPWQQVGPVQFLPPHCFHSAEQLLPGPGPPPITVQLETFAIQSNA